MICGFFSILLQVYCIVIALPTIAVRIFLALKVDCKEILLLSALRANTIVISIIEDGSNTEKNYRESNKEKKRIKIDNFTRSNREDSIVLSK